MNVTTPSGMSPSNFPSPHGCHPPQCTRRRWRSAFVAKSLVPCFFVLRSETIKQKKQKQRIEKQSRHRSSVWGIVQDLCDIFQYKILLYKTKQQQVTNAKISSSFLFSVSIFQEKFSFFLSEMGHCLKLTRCSLARTVRRHEPFVTVTTQNRRRSTHNLCPWNMDVRASGCIVPFISDWFPGFVFQTILISESESRYRRCGQHHYPNPKAWMTARPRQYSAHVESHI